MTTATEHPLAEWSRNCPTAVQPMDDQTPRDFSVGFLPTLKKRIKNRIGLSLYPAMNLLKRGNIQKMLSNCEVDFSNLPRPDAMCMGKKGFGVEVFLRQLSRFVRPGSTVVTFGCGMGYEVLQLARFLRPSRVIGYDFFNFRTAWDWVSHRAKQCGVATTFIQADLRKPIDVNHDPADVLVSFAVLEHLRDMDWSFRIVQPLLRSEGIFASQWGPMWYSYSGDHISGELGEDYGFEHVRLSSDEYLEYYRNHPRNCLDMAAGKPSWLEMGLHNYARYTEYESAITRHFGSIEYRSWQLSPEAIRYRHRFPDRWSTILAANPTLTPLDLILQCAAAIVRPKS